MYYSIIYFIIIALFPYLSAEESEEIIHNRFSAKTYAVKGSNSNNENEETPENISILGGMPSGMINGCVNVITGTYIDSSVDLVTVGAENLVVERIYSSDSEGWEINQPEYIFSRFGLKHCQKGGMTTYSRIKNVHIPNHKSFHSGLTNCGSGIINGRTHLRNSYCYETNIPFLKEGSGVVKHFGTKRNEPDLDGDIYDLSEERKTNRNFVRYGYKDVYNFRIIQSVQSYNFRNHPIASLSYDFKNTDNNGHSLLMVNSSDHQQMCYYFNNCASQGYKKLERVVSQQKPQESYQYHGNKLTHKIRPNGRVRYATYYRPGVNTLYCLPAINVNKNESSKINKSNSYMASKVMSIFEPIGVDATLLPKYQFIYHRSFKDKKGFIVLDRGNTMVYNAKLHPKNYDYDEYQHLTQITDYLNGVYRKQKYQWGPRGTFLEGNLLHSLLTDAFDNVLSCRFYEYDARGNIVREDLSGDLTGKNPRYVKMNAANLPDYNDIEVHSKYFQYSDDGLNLMLYEKDDRKEIYYSYWPETELLARKIIASNSVIRAREFFYYDDNGQVTRHVKDDGYLWEENDLTGVTERHIIHSTFTIAPVGLPLNIEEKFLNLKTGQEELLKRTENIYDALGRLLKQNIYDSQNAYRYSLGWEYDSHNNVTKKINPYGYETYLYYDENDNLACLHDTANRYYTHYEYDYSNRLIASKETHDTGDIVVTRHEYNLLGERIATVNSNGHRTEYVYDNFGRPIEIIYPQVIDENGSLTRYHEYASYDICDNPTQKINKRGVGTNFAYNIRGQVYRTQYTDTSYEQTEYTLDGLVANKRAFNGTKTSYEYDYLERPCKKTMQGINGESIETTTLYNHFHLLEEVDPAGLKTVNQYDNAGRLVAVVKGEIRKEFEYDSLSRLHKTREYFGYGENDFYTHIKEYDLVDRVLEERTEDSKGNIQAKVNFAYDARGNRTQEVHHHLGEPTVTSMSYNAYNQVESTVDALGNLTKVVFHRSHLNAWSQYVKGIETTDPEGNVTFIENDVLERVKFEIRKNSLGEIIQKREFFYDGEGNCVKQIEHVITPDQEDRLVASTFCYDFSNQLVEMVEAVGTPEQKKTQYVYNQNREKESVIKPDGIQLKHTYDWQGRVSQFFASDNSFNYRYTYDINSNVVRVDNLTKDSFTTRIYDHNNRLIEERLPTGLTSKYQYDRLARVTKLIMPDESCVDYVYDHLYLKDVKRKSYTHTYEKYNLSMQVEKSQLIGNASDLIHTYDALQRVVDTTSKYWQETNNHYDRVGNLVKKSGKDSLSSFSYDYGYDELYQLTLEAGSSKHEYKHDSLYNLVKKDNKTHEVNALNQLLNDGEEDSTYDKNGNLILKGDLKLTYDAMDRLVSIAQKDVRVRYSYDELNRRISQSYNNRFEVITTNYHYCSQNEIGSYDEDGRIKELRVLGIGKGAEIGAAILIELKDKVYAPIHDSSGHVRCLIDADTGKTYETYRYSAFGEEEVYDAKNKKRETSLNPWRFSSKRVDAETGFSYFGRRYYNPKTTRWVTADPMGFEAGPNLYAYVFNSPMISFDLYGLEREPGESRWTRERFYEFAYGSNDVKKEGTATESRNQTTEKQKTSDLPKVTFYNFEDGYFHYDKSQALVYPGKGDSKCNGYFCHTGGINNFIDDYIEVCKMFSQSWEDDIALAYNASHMIVNDIREAIIGLFLYVATEPVLILHRSWDRIFNENPNARILQTCHSQGTINVRNALLSYDPIKRLQIDVVAIAPAAYIYSETCGSVHHYRVSIFRDIVPYLDVAGMIRERATTTTVKSHKDAGWMDHSFSSPTYAKIITKHIRDFKKANGGA